MSFSFGKHTPILSPLGFWIWVLISAINCNWCDSNWCDCNCMLVWLQRCDCILFDCNFNRLKCYWLQLIWCNWVWTKFDYKEKCFKAFMFFVIKLNKSPPFSYSMQKSPTYLTCWTPRRWYTFNAKKRANLNYGMKKQIYI